MKHTIKELENCKIEAVSEVDADIWQEAQKKAFHKLASHVSIKGFRPGKAPEAMLRAHVNQADVFNEAINGVLDAVYGDLIVKNQLRPFYRPQVDIEKISDKELTVKFTVTLMPKVELGQYKDLHAEKEAPSVSEEEITEAINRLLENNADLVLVEREAKMGDHVIFDFEGFVDGQPFDGGKADNYELELGSHSFVPGFEEALVGVKPGEEKDVEITFPEQYVAELAGKPATFKCKIHEIKEKQVPALTDEAVAELSIKDEDKEVKTVADLKEQQKKALLANKVSAAENKYYEDLVKLIVDASKVEIAEEIIDQEAATQEENTKQQVESNGLSFQQYLDILGKKEEDLKKEIREQSTANLTRYVVLEELAMKENLGVTDAELDFEIAKMADQYKMTVEDVKKALGNNLESFRQNLHQKKIRDFILANNK